MALHVDEKFSASVENTPQEVLLTGAKYAKSSIIYYSFRNDNTTKLYTYKLGEYSVKAKMNYIKRYVMEHHNYPPNGKYRLVCFCMETGKEIGEDAYITTGSRVQWRRLPPCSANRLIVHTNRQMPLHLYI